MVTGETIEKIYKPYSMKHTNKKLQKRRIQFFESVMKFLRKRKTQLKTFFAFGFDKDQCVSVFRWSIIA